MKHILFGILVLFLAQHLHADTAYQTNGGGGTTVYGTFGEEVPTYTMKDTASNRELIYNKENNDLIGYIDENGNAVIGEVTGSSVTGYGSENQFEGTNKALNGEKSYNKEGAGSSTTAKGTSTTDSQACGAAYAKAQSMCKGAVLAQKTQEIQQMMSMMQSAQSANNTKKACETAAKINTLTGALNGAVGGTCLYSVNACRNKCKEASTKTGNTMYTSTGVEDLDIEDTIKACNSLSEAGMAAVYQAMQNAMTVVASKACADQVADKCLGENAANDEECVQFCLKPGRQDHPKCRVALNNCSNQTYASQNVQMCTCMMNPLAPNCQGAQLGTLTPAKAPALNLNEDAMGGSDYDFNGTQGGGNPAMVNSPDGSGGGFGGGGGGSQAFGENGGGGSPGEPLNKDILTGTGGSGGAAGIFGGGGGYLDGGGMGGKKGGNGEEKGFDLSAFLPGGKKDPTRNPASAGYEDSTITKANGLTNFQKITRKMNEKRPELAP